MAGKGKMGPETFKNQGFVGFRRPFGAKGGMGTETFKNPRVFVGVWRHYGEKGEMGPKTSVTKGFHRVSEALEANVIK